MMGGRGGNQEQLFYSFSLEVTKENLLGSIHLFLDLSGCVGSWLRFAATGRPSIDPALMIRMLVIRYRTGADDGFTHLSSSVCLILIPFVPDLGYAIALLLVRSALSQMDVPTRSSYVMAIQERAAAASITSVPRSLASAASPALAGWMLGLSSFGWPLIAGGAIKIVYDLLLLAMFEKVRPPEERARPADS